MDHTIESRKEIRVNRNMKVICIKDSNVHDYRFKVTAGKIYQSKNHGNLENYIKVLNDEGMWDGFPRDWFESIDVIRDNKLNEILNEL
jgi:hypothetical protein